MSSRGRGVACQGRERRSNVTAAKQHAAAARGCQGGRLATASAVDGCCNCAPGLSVGRQLGLTVEQTSALRAGVQRVKPRRGPSWAAASYAGTLFRRAAVRGNIHRLGWVPAQHQDHSRSAWVLPGCPRARAGAVRTRHTVTLGIGRSCLGHANGGAPIIRVTVEMLGRDWLDEWSGVGEGWRCSARVVAVIHA